MKLFGGKKDADTAPETEAPRVGFFDRMKQAVSRTRESLSSKIEGIVALTRTVDESTLENLEAALLTSDLGVQTTTRILDALRDRFRTLVPGRSDALEAPRAPPRGWLQGSTSRC